MNGTITVDLIKFRCICERCHYDFFELDFSEFDYGRRLLRTISGDRSAVWIGPEDETYEEFKGLMHGIIPRSMSPRDEAKLFNRVFGISCDPIEGEPVDASRGYVCPKCGSGDVDTFDVVPKQVVQKTLPLISHELWRIKSLDQRERTVRSALTMAEGTGQR